MHGHFHKESVVGWRVWGTNRSKKVVYILSEDDGEDKALKGRSYFTIWEVSGKEEMLCPGGAWHLAFLNSC